jgi:hypothetical protein
MVQYSSFEPAFDGPSHSWVGVELVEEWPVRDVIKAALDICIEDILVL